MGFSSEQIKKIAMGAMAMDHAALMLARNATLWRSGFVKGLYLAMRLLGRVAFPLFAFLLAEGFFCTRDKKNYAFRLGLFALLSEIPYNLFINGHLLCPETQNTLFTLTLGLVSLIVSERLSERTGSASWVVSGLVFGILAEAFRLDYGFLGIVLIQLLAYFRFQPQKKLVAGCVVLYLSYWEENALGGVAACLAFSFINHYNGERGKHMGYIPYLFYPVHLLIFYGLGVVQNGIHF